MSDLWIVDGNKRKPFSGKPGHKYDRTGPKKVCVHTTQGKNLRGAENAYKKYPPHIGCDFRTRTVHQYVPLNKASYSARGSENDDEPMIQVEIVGYAQQSHTWPVEMLEWLVDEVLFPIWQLWPYEPYGPPKGFKGEMNKEAIWASSKSPLRFSDREFEQFSGILGHQHLPAPDTHWDPGAIDIETILVKLRGRISEVEAAKETEANDAIEKEIMALAAATAARFDKIESRLNSLSSGVGAPIDQSAYTDVLLGIIENNLSDYDLAYSTFVAVFNQTPTREEVLSWMDQLRVDPLPNVIDIMVGVKNSAAS